MAMLPFVFLFISAFSVVDHCESFPQQRLSKASKSNFNTTFLYFCICCSEDYKLNQIFACKIEILCLSSGVSEIINDLIKKFNVAYL